MKIYGIQLEPSEFVLSSTCYLTESLLSRYGVIINNYGQTSDIVYNLPPASSSGMSFILIVATDASNSIKIQPYYSNKIILYGTDSVSGQAIELSYIKSGSVIEIISAKTEDDKYEWIVKHKIGNWTFLPTWLVTSSLNVNRGNLAGCGNINNALSFGGNNGKAIGVTEMWNNNVWSTLSSLNFARESLAGCGDSNRSLSFGGGPITK